MAYKESVDCLNAINDLKNGRLKYILLGIDPTGSEVILKDTGNRQTADYLEFISKLRTSQPCYGIYAFNKTESVNSTVLFMWLPDYGTVEDKLKVVSNLASLKNRFKVEKAFTATTVSDLRAFPLQTIF
ncbi:unnamed protein product [Blepharisma stoltei]|uniref:ADF-H domain-containing protein n=1 Tax=Blepharisma stoltei TaxID=1481888 RepID=A0AAU9JBD3_9CILI|nr:unnamed protein product [Blepharisma stoltei]